MIYDNVGAFRNPLQQDPKRIFVAFKIILSNYRIFSFYSTSEHNTREQLAREVFFEGKQKYVENKNEGNESKVILGEFNCTFDNMDMDGGSN